MLEKYKMYTSKPTNNVESKTVLEAIWEDAPQDTLDTVVLAFQKKLQSCNTGSRTPLCILSQVDSITDKLPFAGLTVSS